MLCLEIAGLELKESYTDNELVLLLVVMNTSSPVRSELVPEREAFRLSQPIVGEIVGCTRSNVHRIERLAISKIRRGLDDSGVTREELEAAFA